MLRHSCERCALGVDDDVGDLAAADGLADVSVAEGAAWGQPPIFAFCAMPFLISLAKLAE